MTTQRKTHWLVDVALTLALAIASVAVLLLVVSDAFAQTANRATITFEPSTRYTDGTVYPTGAVVSYDLYQGLRGAAKTRVGTVTSGGNITTGLLTGNEYCWDVVTLVKIGTAAAVESAHSTEACKSFAGTPSVVTITVT